MRKLSLLVLGITMAAGCCSIQTEKPSEVPIKKPQSDNRTYYASTLEGSMQRLYIPPTVFKLPDPTFIGEDGPMYDMWQ
ncbi:hypothetical protein HN747_00335 [archaeon]|jgi:hypothetical protein|nr:hypothetical protein [archaeon]